MDFDQKNEENRNLEAILGGLQITLSRRRSCELVETASPCVKKALFHLTNLQKIISNEGQISPCKDTKGREITILESNSKLKEMKDCFVEEVEADPVYCLKPYQETPKEVFKQVAELIIRLEEDRSKTEKALVIENERLDDLNKKIGDLMLKRMKILPQVVQNEHEKYVSGIGELQWYVTNSNTTKDEAMARLKEVQEDNNALHNDIEFIKSHCPLVEEKLELEKNALKKIRKREAEAEKALQLARNELQMNEEMYQKKDHENKLEMERYDQILSAAQKELLNLQQKYENSKLLEKSYRKKENLNQLKLTSIKEDYQRLVSSVGVLEQEKEGKLSTLKDLESRLKLAADEEKSLVEQINQANKDIYKTTTTNESKLSNLSEIHNDKQLQLYELEKENKELDAYLKEQNERLDITENSIEKTKFEIGKYKKECRKNEEKIMKLMSNIADIQKKNFSIKEQIEREEILSKDLEIGLQTKLDTLNRQVDAEMKIRTEFEAKTHNNMKNVKILTAEKTFKEEAMKIELNDNKAALKKAEDELNIVIQQHNKVNEVVKNLQDSMTKMTAFHEIKKTELTTKKSSLISISQALQTENKELEDKLSNLELQTDDIKPKIADLKISQTMISKKIQETNDKIEVLNKDLGHTKANLLDKQNFLNMIRMKVEEAKIRLRYRETIHFNLMKGRKVLMKEIQDQAQANISFNKFAAGYFKQLQAKEMDLKDKLMDLHGEKTVLEISVHDYKQLIQMQTKLNLALERYYEDRSVFNNSNLNMFKKRAKDNTKLIAEVRKGLEISLENVTDFLADHLDGVAENKVREAGQHVLDNSVNDEMKEEFLNSTITKIK